MNVSNSECSSGCESGWTMYLDQTSNSTDKYTRVLVKNVNPDQEDDDEDLSMLSDASSGPPQFQEHENYARGNNLQLFHGHIESSAPAGGNKKKSKQNKNKAKDQLMRIKRQESFCLDDTATSPLPHHFAQDNLAPSGTHLQEFNSAEGEPITKKHTGFFKSSTKGKSSSTLFGRKKQ
ncbi:protein SOB FIVE-LIKE 5-like [Henckelia pumila]|uniref:protein SOB FIVE-LIKE 5-like n=1 Tax=Henckelia pumila TaxID=405737 RepID=UPI003C6DBB0F